MDHEARLAARQQGWGDGDRDAQGTVLRSVAEDGLAKVTSESMAVVVGQINNLALTTQRLERSPSESVRRERQTREEESLRTVAEIAKKAADEAGTGGPVPVERLRQIASDVYGVWVDKEKPEA